MSGTELSGSIPNPTSTTPTPGAGSSSKDDNDLLNQNQTSNNANQDKDELDSRMKQLEELMKFVDEINDQLTGAINQAISPMMGAAGNAISQGFNSVQGMFSSGSSNGSSNDAPEMDNDQDDSMGMGAGMEMSMMSSDTMTNPMDEIENMPELDQFQSIVSGPSQGQSQDMGIEEEVTQGVSMVM
ncbi:hypothetical protein [Legionella erythra]|uniref:Uncharacterized protein n=1 Tax=Legionella erythra TaxID=448 RepID=A0A0W0TVV6_LEGER|nr:hypothetical protein [Legionella erythra]KTC99847.1 hypothetical protein Lery_0201 [Legionella erythra]